MIWREIGNNHSWVGYQYKPWEDRDVDVIKIKHEIETPSGEIIDGPWSPYVTPTLEQFAEYVDQHKLEILAQNRKHYG